MKIKDLDEGIKRYLRPFYNFYLKIVWMLSRRLNKTEIINEPLRLHLGCGPVDAPGYINVDIRPYPHIDHLSLAYPLNNFQTDKYDLVYASHILEHFQELMPLTF